MILRYFLKRKFSLALSSNPKLTYLVESLKLKAKGAEHRLVSPTTKLVIEGPPRCGNSSALRLVISKNPAYKKNIATHIHRPFQLRYAMEYGVPAVVMLRNPEASTISHASLLCQLDQVRVKDDREREQLLWLCIEEYITFVRDMIDLGFRHILVFEDYVKKPEILIDYLNQLHHLGLPSSGYEQEGADAVHVFPSEQRDALKQAFWAIAQKSPKIKKLMCTAKHYHEALISERILPSEQ